MRDYQPAPSPIPLPQEANDDDWIAVGQSHFTVLYGGRFRAAVQEPISDRLRNLNGAIQSLVAGSPDLFPYDTVGDPNQNERPELADYDAFYKRLLATPILHMSVEPEPGVMPHVLMQRYLSLFQEHLSTNLEIVLNDVERYVETLREI